METPRRILRLPEVKKRTGYGRSSIYALMKEGKFPQSRKIGIRAIGWDSEEIQAWIDKKLDG